MVPSRRLALFLAKTYESRLGGNFQRSGKPGASSSDPAEFDGPPPGGRVRRVISSGAKRASDERQPPPADDRATPGVATAGSRAFGGLRSCLARSFLFKATSALLQKFAVRRMTYPALSRFSSVPTIALSAMSSRCLSGDFGIPMNPSSPTRPFVSEGEEARRGSNVGPLFPEGSKEEIPDKAPRTAGGFSHSIAKVFLVERLFPLSRILDGKPCSRIT